jgi:hypothetical protein
MGSSAVLDCGAANGAVLLCAMLSIGKRKKAEKQKVRWRSPSSSRAYWHARAADLDG